MRMIKKIINEMKNFFLEIFTWWSSQTLGTRIYTFFRGKYIGSDNDGNKYLDLICGWGPMILGYNNSKIDKAARTQYDLGNTVSVASPVMVELAETLTDMVDMADWALFGKNGGDSTQLAIMVARAETGKSKILKIKDGYHGANGWMQNKNNPGIINSDSEEVLSISSVSYTHLTLPTNREV